jgi:hypothetical protein
MPGYGYGIAEVLTSNPASGGAPPFEYTPIANNYSMTFDGTNYINTGLDCSSATHPSITVSCWLRYPVEPPYHFGLYYAAGVKSANGQYQGLGLMNGGRIANKANGVWTTGTSLRDNTWHNVVWVCEYDTPSAGDTRMTVYLDGNPTPDIITIDTSGGQLIGDLSIGSLGGTQSYFDGNIDEVAVWNSVLSEDTIEKIYNTTNDNPGKVADLSETPEGAPLAWYRFE